MTTNPPPDRLPLFVATFGAAISTVTFSVAGGFAAFSAAVGAALALANLVVLRSIVLRVVTGDIHMKLPLLALIFVKMGVVMGLVFWVITKHWVEPIAFTVGLSSLFVGLIAGSLFFNRAAARSQSHRSES
jgi:hypothetical protein